MFQNRNLANIHHFWIFSYFFKIYFAILWTPKLWKNSKKIIKKSLRRWKKSEKFRNCSRIIFWQIFIIWGILVNFKSFIPPFYDAATSETRIQKIVKKSQKITKNYKSVPESMPDLSKYFSDFYLFFKEFFIIYFVILRWSYQRKTNWKIHKNWEKSGKIIQMFQNQFQTNLRIFNNFPYFLKIFLSIISKYFDAHISKKWI